MLPSVPLWASCGDITTVEQRALRIEVDLLCELVTVSGFHHREVQFCAHPCALQVSIQRSDFEATDSVSLFYARNTFENIFISISRR